MQQRTTARADTHGPAPGNWFNAVTAWPAWLGKRKGYLAIGLVLIAIAAGYAFFSYRPVDRTSRQGCLRTCQSASSASAPSKPAFSPRSVSRLAPRSPSSMPITATLSERARARAAAHHAAGGESGQGQGRRSQRRSGRQEGRCQRHQDARHPRAKAGRRTSASSNWSKVAGDVAAGGRRGAAR